MRRRLLGVLLAFSVLGVAACDRPAGDGLLSSQSPTAPNAVSTGLATVSSALDYSRVILLQGDSLTPAATVSEVVGTAGGRLSIGAHALNIWPGSVDEPLRFTFTVKQTPYLTADMSAVRVSDGAAVTTFKAPLHLKLSYARAATPIPDANQLHVYYVVNGVVREVTVSGADSKGQTVYANIWHFSEYSPGLDAME